ncbi:MAG: SemiSWEET family transporter [Dehalococcoidia bacterium]
MSIELVGWVAVVLTQVFWFPNISKILRTRDVDGYSLTAWLIMLVGLSCWLAYFTVKGDVVGIVANVSGVTGAGVTTACIWFWGRGKAKTPHLIETKTLPVQPSSLGEPLTTDQG